MDEIIKGCLYLGGADALKVNELKAKGLQKVLSLGMKPTEEIISNIQSSLVIEIADLSDADLLSHIPSYITFLSSASRPPNQDAEDDDDDDDSSPSQRHQQQQPTLIHCVHGQSRSVAAILSYLMINQGKKLEDAYALVAQSRAQICINPGFLRQLALLNDLVLAENRNRRRAWGEYRSSMVADIMAYPHRPEASQLIENLAMSVKALEETIVIGQKHHVYDATDDDCVQQGEADEEMADADEQDDDEEEEDDDDGIKKADKNSKWKCRGCQQELFSDDDILRHGEMDTIKAKESLLSLAKLTPDASSFYNYEYEFTLQSMLHLMPCCPKMKKGRGQKKHKKHHPPKEEKEEERMMRKETTCPWLYVQPIDWILSSDSWKTVLMTPPTTTPEDASSSPQVALRCPGRHCHTAIGMIIHNDGSSTRPSIQCECGGAVPRLMIQIDRKYVVQKR